MLEIRKSEFKPEEYSRLNLIRNHKNGSADYEYLCECDRCMGKGYVISHVLNGKPVLMRPENGICFKCRGSKVMTQKIKVMPDELVDAKEAAAKKKAAEEMAAWEARKQEIVNEKIAAGWKKVDFKVAGWFAGRDHDVFYNKEEYYLITKETAKAVCIRFTPNLASGTYSEDWFPKKAIIREENENASQPI